jgi:hypothetical protein
MSSLKRKRDLLDDKQKREIISYVFLIRGEGWDLIVSTRLTYILHLYKDISINRSHLIVKLLAICCCVNFGFSFA